MGGLAGTGAVQTAAGISQGLGQGLAGVYGNAGQGVGSSLQQLGQIIGQGHMQQAAMSGQMISGINSAFQGSIAGFNALENQRIQNAIYERLIGGGAAAGGGIYNAQGLRTGWGFGG
jgi:hypothetical protein